MMQFKTEGSLSDHNSQVITFTHYSHNFISHE